MGQVITQICGEDAQIELVAGVDVFDREGNGYPVFANISSCDVPADVIIDFSNAKAVDDLLVYAADKRIPVVLCTTGLSKEQLARVTETAAKTAVLKSANMSETMNTNMTGAASAGRERSARSEFRPCGAAASWGSTRCCLRDLTK